MARGRFQLTPRWRRLTGALLATLGVIPVNHGLADPLRLYAAGSLTAAFTDIVKAFPTSEGDVITPVFGPSGILREKIERGDHVDVFASADMEQPRRLARSPNTSVVMFTRNRLCALGRSSIGLTPDNLLDRPSHQRYGLQPPRQVPTLVVTMHGLSLRAPRQCTLARRPSSRLRR
jgi:ABC-type molybdate transport system substrate-binding protein